MRPAEQGQGFVSEQYQFKVIGTHGPGTGIHAWGSLWKQLESHFAGKATAASGNWFTTTPRFQGAWLELRSANWTTQALPHEGIAVFQQDPDMNEVLSIIDRVFDAALAATCRLEFKVTCRETVNLDVTRPIVPLPAIFNPQLAESLTGLVRVDAFESMLSGQMPPDRQFMLRLGPRHAGAAADYFHRRQSASQDEPFENLVFDFALHEAPAQSDRSLRSRVLAMAEDTAPMINALRDRLAPRS